MPSGVEGWRMRIHWRLAMVGKVQPLRPIVACTTRKVLALFSTGAQTGYVSRMYAASMARDASPQSRFPRTIGVGCPAQAGLNAVSVALAVGDPGIAVSSVTPGCRSKYPSGAAESPAGTTTACREELRLSLALDPWISPHAEAALADLLRFNQIGTHRRSVRFAGDS